MDNDDWRASSKPIAVTTSTTRQAKTPVAARNPRSRDAIGVMDAQEMFSLLAAVNSIWTTLAGNGAYPSSLAYFWPSARAHLRKSSITFALSFSGGFSYSSSQVKDEIGYAFSPGAFVMETRKSGGMSVAAPAAAAVTVSGEAFTNIPEAFWTEAKLIL